MAMNDGTDEHVRKIAREEAERATRVIEIDLLKQHFLTRDEFLDAMERMDKRFVAMQEQMDKRFDAVDKRFVAMDKRFMAMDKRFDRVDAALADIRSALGVPFEQFARNVVSRVLAGEGFPGVALRSVKLPDPAGAVFPATKEVQVDGLSDDPPVIVEVTTVLREIEKIDDFLKKKAFVEQQHPGRQYRGFFVAATSTLSQEAMADAIVRLKARGCELLNL